jgi:ribA/ribD-fused uncharacterized protein
MTANIGFYDAKEQPYGVLTNYYPVNINIDGVVYGSTEHYYQCEKFTDQWYREQIRQTNTPNKSRILGHQKTGGGYKWRTDLNPIIQESLVRGVQRKDNFDETKDTVMLVALWAKFTQHINLQKILLSTGNNYIFENAPNDPYWGIGSDGKGQNKLGRLLMYVRDEIGKSLQSY